MSTLKTFATRRSTNTSPRSKQLKRWLLAASVCGSLGLAAAPAIAAPVAFTGSYTQDFQSMTGTTQSSYTTNTTVLVGSMTEVSGLTGGVAGVNGWYIYGSGWTGSLNKWGINNGSSTTGAFLQLVDGAGGRALGSQGSGTTAGFFGVVLQNTSGSTINDLNLSYSAVMNRNPSTTANPYPLSYRTSATNVVAGASTADGTFADAAGTWNTTTLGFTTPTTGTGAPGTQAAITPLFQIGGAPISGNLTGLNWANNSYLYLRWSETDNSGADASAGVDNFSLAALVSRNLTWNVGNGTWDTSTANWTGDGTVFINGDKTTFNNVSGGTITLSGALAPTSTTVSAGSGTYTFTGTAADKLTGSGTLLKSGGGTLAVGLDNDFSGGTSITGGILSVDGNNRLGTGAIAIDGGTLKSAAASATVLPNNVIIGSTGGMIDTGSQNLSVASMTSLTGVLTKSGTGNLTVTGNFAPAAGGGVSVASGNLILGQASGIVNIGASGVLTGNMVINGPIRLNINDSANLSGTGQLQVTTTGTLISQVSGNVGGTISAPIGLNSNNTAFTPTSWTGNTYTPSSFITTIGGTTGGGLTINAAISGNADVDFSNNSTTGGGTGFVNLNTAATFTGDAIFNGNTNAPVKLGVNNALPTSAGVIVGTKTGVGTPILDLNGRNQQVAYLADGANVTAAKFLTITNTGTADSVLTVSGSTTTGVPFSGIISDGATNKVALVKAGSNTQILSGANTYTGTTTVSAGRLTIASTGTINTSAGITINGGELKYNSSTPLTQPITLTSGTISGTGTISSPISVGAGAILSPGNSPGIQSYGATQTWTPGGTYVWEVNNWTGTTAGTDFDQIAITGGLDIAALSSANRFNIDITGLTAGNIVGGVPNFNNSVARTWTILTTTTGLTGQAFNPNLFTLATTNFVGANSLGGGSFALTNVGNDLVLNFNPAAAGGPNVTVSSVTNPNLFVLQNASLTTLTATANFTNSNANAATIDTPTSNPVGLLSGTTTSIAAGPSSTATSTISLLNTATNTTQIGATLTYPTTAANTGSAVATVNVRIGNAPLAGSNTSTTFGATLTAATPSGPLTSYPNLASNTLDAAQVATTGSPVKLGTTATILEYKNVTGGDSGAVNMSWRTRTAGEAYNGETLQGGGANVGGVAKGYLISDVVSLSGMDNGSGITDTFVLQMSYNVGLLLGFEDDGIANGNIFIGWKNGGGNWVNAAFGNNNGAGGAFYVGDRDYIPGTDGLGTFGIDKATSTVWAVLNHEGQFAVIPEPSTFVLGGLALLGFAGAGLRKRRMKQPA